MGVIGRLLGGPAATTALGQAATGVAEVFTATGVAEVFTANATKKMQAAHDAYIAALSEFGGEFQNARPGLFDRVVNGLNRLPRPMLALGTLGLFTYAMVDPESFTRRMVGLNYVPEPLWWLLAAIVGFYFGAREAHYFRARPQIAPPPASPAESQGDRNPALEEIIRRTSG